MKSGKNEKLQSRTLLIPILILNCVHFEILLFGFFIRQKEKIRLRKVFDCHSRHEYDFAAVIHFN